MSEKCEDSCSVVMSHELLCWDSRTVSPLWSASLHSNVSVGLWVTFYLDGAVFFRREPSSSRLSLPRKPRNREKNMRSEQHHHLEGSRQNSPTDYTVSASTWYVLSSATYELTKTKERQELSRSSISRSETSNVPPPMS